MRVKNKHIYELSEKTQFALILYTKSHFEPFSVRRACTKSYVTSEPYPRASQSWCQNVRETRKKIVIKCRGKSFASCRVIARNVEGGGPSWPPPPSLIRVKVILSLSLIRGMNNLCQFKERTKTAQIDVILSRFSVEYR